MLDRSFLVPLAPEVRKEFLAWAAAVDQQAVNDVLAGQRDLADAVRDVLART